MLHFQLIMHNKFLRSTILVTFLLSLACVSLVCTSLVTDHWIESKPSRKRNPSESSGHINFGLLHGRKELDVSVGVRFHEIQVVLSIICSTTWYAQCQLKLYHNVLTEQDLDNFWTSEGATILGYSFWLIIVVGVLHVTNLLLLKWSTLKGGRKRQETLNPLEEKMVGAIMLY
ncbi:unnamed protein product [Trichogramma brassicae]|uniref:Uncharacterized protein n=1 Tax=Trichogramma brassicae TaxID=86971 RepID=A0A6H5IIY1_9HYME|nr:unnamed protein product [Trichogramma brassicae]